MQFLRGDTRYSLCFHRHLDVSVDHGGRFQHARHVTALGGILYPETVPAGVVGVLVEVVVVDDQDVLDVAEDSEELETADEADLAVDEDEDTFEDEDSSEHGRLFLFRDFQFFD